MCSSDLGALELALPLAGTARAVPGGRPNMVALGVLATLLGFDPEAVDAVVAQAVAWRGDAAVAASRACLRAGAALPAQAPDRLHVPLRLHPAAEGARRWLVTGNQALAVGALRGGIRFVAGYPITPATELLEWIAPRIGRLGGGRR